MGASNLHAAADDLSGNYIASQYVTRQLDLVQVKGRSSGTAVYEVVGRRMPLPFISTGENDNAYVNAAVDCNWTPVIRAEHTSQFTVTNNKENAPILSHFHKFTGTYNKAIAAYFRRDFEAAIEGFTAMEALKRELCVIQAKVRKYKKMVRARHIAGEHAAPPNPARIGVGVLDQVELDDSEVEYSEDLPSRLLLERCREFLLNPPPADWDGVEILKGKTG